MWRAKHKCMLLVMYRGGVKQYDHTSNAPTCVSCDTAQLPTTLNRTAVVDPFRTSTTVNGCCGSQEAELLVSQTQDELSKMTVLAAGGYGRIFGNESKVYKVFTKTNSCTDSKYEYDVGMKLHTVINSLKLDSIVTPRPLGYVVTPFVYESELFQCYFAMERMRGFTCNGRELLVHCTLQYPDKNGEEGKTDAPIDISNPSRGWFAGENHIPTITGVSSDVIARRIGLVMVILIMDVQIFPFDVEYLINKKQELVVLDFGLSKHIAAASFDDMDSLVEKAFSTGGDSTVGIAYDLYYPADDSKVKVQFIRGIEEGVRRCKDPIKAATIERYVKQDLKYKE